MSIGVSVATDPARSPVDLYREADLALYRAKDAGRDQYALFDDELRARADRRMSAETLLRRALGREPARAGLPADRRPGDGRIRAAEALVRIQDGDRLVLPAEFIDVAEETGLIVEVDARMFERVAAECARLLDTGALLRRLTTNVSARSLEDPTFVEPDAPGADLVRRTRLDDPGRAHRAQPADDQPGGRESLARIQEPRHRRWASTTSAPATRRWPTCSASRCSSSRSTGRSSAGSATARDDAVVGAVIDLAHAHELVVVGEGVETARAARRAAPDGLRPRAGLPDGPADAGRRARRPAAHRPALVAGQRVGRARAAAQVDDLGGGRVLVADDVVAHPVSAVRRSRSAGHGGPGHGRGAAHDARRGRSTSRAARPRPAAGPCSPLNDGSSETTGTTVSQRVHRGHPVQRVPCRRGRWSGGRRRTA